MVPAAVFWAPTQRDRNPWDLSAQLPNALHFVFEYKGVEGYHGPYVPINPQQLDSYIALNYAIGGTFVWYVLPMWEHNVQPGSVLPAEALLRTLRAQDPRPS